MSQKVDFLHTKNIKNLEIRSLVLTNLSTLNNQLNQDISNKTL